MDESDSSRFDSGPYNDDEMPPGHSDPHENNFNNDDHEHQQHEHEDGMSEDPFQHEHEQEEDESYDDNNEEPWHGDEYGGPPPHWRGGRGGPPHRGGPPPRGFMRGRGGFGHPGGPPGRGRFPGPPRGGPPNGFGPPRGRGGFGGPPRGPPPHGWGDPNFGPPGMGPPPGGPHGGPPPGMMPPWGMGPPPNAGPGGGPPPHHMGYGNGPPHQDQQQPPQENLDIDLTGEVWVETKADDNKSYYYNARTRETTWTKPEGEGVKILSQEEIEKISQKVAPTSSGAPPGAGQGQPGPGGDDQQKQQQQPPYGMPPPGFMPPPGQYGMPPNGPPPYGMPPGFPPPWGMPPGGAGGGPPGQFPPWGSMPPGVGGEICDWSEHTAPDGKKYYYNARTQESVWEKPKELAEFEKKQQQQQKDTPPVVTQQQQQAAPLAIPGTETDHPVSPFKAFDPKPVPKAEDVAAKLKEKAEAAPAKPAKPQDKSRPVSSTPVTGSPWCVVWTGDNRVFFYNPTTKSSVWERPPELAGRPDVTEMLKSPAASEKQKAKQNKKKKKSDDLSDQGPDDSDDSEDSDHRPPPVKQKKVETELVFEDELAKKDNDIEIVQETKTKIDKGKEAAMEAEVRAARERALIPLDTRMKQFRDLLAEKEISAFSTWEKELHKIVFDPRYLLLTSKERKNVFDKYVRDRADEERREKKNKLKEKKESFRKLLSESKLHSKSSYSDFSSKYGKDERFKGIDKSRERESLFNEYLIELRKKEKEERAEKQKRMKKDFLAMLTECTEINRHSHWSDIKKKLDSDPRYKAIESSNQKEDYFLDYVHDLKEEHRKNKEKKKRHHSRSRSRTPKRSRKSRSKSPVKKKKKNKDRSRSKERIPKEKEEGEMSEEEHHEKRKKSSTEENGTKESSVEGNSSKSDNRKSVDETKDHKMDEEEADPEASRELKEQREKEQRVAASLKKREEEVQREMSEHLQARDKEREQHRHQEAISHFQALLTDLIRHPDYTWKEAKKIIKKDARYDSASTLEKSERERLFDNHIDMLIAKKRENYWQLLDECKEINLDSGFKDIKKLVRDDPRYSKYSSSDRKCEKQFNEYIKNKVSMAKEAFRALLVETKKITDKSYALAKDKDSGHLQEIEELLKKDKRYLDLDGMSEARKDILMLYLEEVERRGPPPPPTASEPGRRSAKI